MAARSRAARIRPAATGPPAAPEPRCSGTTTARACATTTRPSPGIPRTCPARARKAPPAAAKRRCKARAVTDCSTASPRTSSPFARKSESPSVRERIRAQLELQDLRPGAFAALDVERSPGGIGRPQGPSLPAGARVVDAAIEPLRVKTHGVRHAENHEFPVLERKQRVVGVAGRDRRIAAQSEGVVLIHPRVIARLGAARVGHALQLRSGERIERPAFGAVLARGARAVERSLALAPVETREMSARERRPDDAFAIDVHAARRIAGERRLEHFRERRLRRIRSRIHANDETGVTEHRSPDGAVNRARGESVETGHDALVLLRIYRIVRPHVIVAPAVAVGVQNERGPALRLLLVAGLLEHPSVEPPEDLVRRAA